MLQPWAGVPGVGLQGTLANPLANTKMNRNSVFFKFAHDSVIEAVDFQGKEIAVGDLKATIAERKKLSKFDLELVNEKTNEVYSKDGAMLQRNITILVRRSPAQNHERVELVPAGEDIWTSMAEAKAAKKNKPQVPIERRACPPEYLCPLCRHIFDSPSIARCCGRSACAKCFAGRGGGSCPLCGKACDESTTPIPNPRLAETVASLNLDYFVVPGQPEPAAAAAQGVASAAPQPLAAPGSAPPPVPGRPSAPPGMTLMPAMLSPEQFRAWQMSLRSAPGSSSSSESGRRGKRKGKDAKKKQSKRKRRREEPPPEAAYAQDPAPRKAKKAHKRREGAADDAFQ